MTVGESALSAELNRIGRVIRENKVAKGWTVTTSALWPDTDHVPAVLCLIHSEVSEALEAFRKDDKDNFAEELADVFIRLVGLADGLGIDLAVEAWAKVEKNAARPFHHGGKRL